MITLKFGPPHSGVAIMGWPRALCDVHSWKRVNAHEGLVSETGFWKLKLGLFQEEI